MSESKVKYKKIYDLIQREFNYSFSNKDLLLEAITHKSISKLNYERLEFLGDAVLQLIITKYLFNKYTNHKEGYLSREKQSIVSKKVISKLSLDMGLLSVLRSNNLNIEDELSLKESLAADIIEALIGAIFLDSNYSRCEDIVLKIFNSYLDEKKDIGMKDPKTLLQEYLQSTGQPLPKYKTTQINGPSHAPEFRIECLIKIYKSPIYVISKTVQSGQQEVSQILLDKINNDENL